MLLAVAVITPHPHPTMFVQDATTPVYIAVQNGRLEVVKALLASGANKEATRQVSGPPAEGHVCMYACAC